MVAWPMAQVLGRLAGAGDALHHLDVDVLRRPHTPRRSAPHHLLTHAAHKLRDVRGRAEPHAPRHMRSDAARHACVLQHIRVEPVALAPQRGTELRPQVLLHLRLRRPLEDLANARRAEPRLAPLAQPGTDAPQILHVHRAQARDVQDVRPTRLGEARREACLQDVRADPDTRLALRRRANEVPYSLAERCDAEVLVRVESVGERMAIAAQQRWERMGHVQQRLVDTHHLDRIRDVDERLVKLARRSAIRLERIRERAHAGAQRLGALQTHAIAHAEASRDVVARRHVRRARRTRAMAHDDRLLLPRGLVAQRHTHEKAVKVDVHDRARRIVARRRIMLLLGDPGLQLLLPQAEVVQSAMRVKRRDHIVGIECVRRAWLLRTQAAAVDDPRRAHDTPRLKLAALLGRQVGRHDVRHVALRIEVRHEAAPVQKNEATQLRVRRIRASIHVDRTPTQRVRLGLHGLRLALQLRALVLQIRADITERHRIVRRLLLLLIVFERLEQHIFLTTWKARRWRGHPRWLGGRGEALT